MLNYPLLYLEHLSDRDLELLGRAAGAGGEAARAHFREHPRTLDELLGSPALYEAIFEPRQPGLGPTVTPFLAFGVLVNRAARELRTARYVTEWTGPGSRLPVFDVEPLRQFLDDPVRRFFLIEFLSSFIKVASGSFWVRTRRGYRRRRFSEMDPVQLAEMVEQLPEPQRAGGYRRLGDVALFLCGVFPDHTASHPVPVMQRELLARSAAIPAIRALGGDRGLDFLEAAGTGWYRRAVDTAAAAMGAGPEFLLDVADRFIEARRILNYLADHYLHRRDLGLMRPTG